MAQSKRLFRGLPVVDATHATSITLTKRDIMKGDAREASYCAVAHAFKREQKREAVVHTSMVYIREGGRWLRYPVPERLRIEIIVFDRFGNLAEGEYELRPPKRYQRLDYKPPSKAKPTAKRRRHHTTEGVRGKPHYGTEEEA